MLGRLSLAWRAWRAWSHGIERMKEASMNPPANWKTKTGAVIGALGWLATLALKVVNGEADLLMTLPEAMAVIGAAVTVWGGRDAAQKAIDAISGK